MHGMLGGEIPEYIKVNDCQKIDELDVSQLDLVFSAVESEAARDIETKMAADSQLSQLVLLIDMKMMFQYSFQELMTNMQSCLKFKRKIETGKVG